MKSKETKLTQSVFVLALGTLLFALCTGVQAQQPIKTARIGYLFVGLQPPKEFFQALGKFGYVEGKNIIFEYRTAEGKSD